MCELIADHCEKGPLSMFFAVFININIFKCIQIALNTLFIILVKKKNQLSKGISQFRARSGPILSDPVIRPDPVNTQTQKNRVIKSCCIVCFTANEQKIEKNR